MWVFGETQRLVRPGIECANDDLCVREGIEHFAVDRGLLVDRGFGLSVEEAQFGPEQPDPTC